MKAESILIERMAGKSTVAFRVPNHTRENHLAARSGGVTGIPWGPKAS